MKKNLLITIIFFLFPAVSNPQNVSVPSTVLTGIEFSININELPDSLKYVTLNIDGGDSLRLLRINAVNGTSQTKLKLDYAGRYLIYLSEFDKVQTKVNAIPALLSIVPPLLAILLALLLRQVIVALVLGVLSGAVFVNDFNPLTGLLRLIDTYIINALNDQSHIMIIIFTMLFGGVVGVISRNGGTRGIANLIMKFATTRRRGLISTWLMGLAIFFDDYANTLIVGNLMRPLTNKLKISREKLAFLVDSTSAPVASLVIVSTWVGYEVGLIQEGLRIISSNENAYDVFLQTIPYRFYPIAMLIFVFILSYMQRDFGPMYAAEKNAIEGKSFLKKDNKSSNDLTETADIFDHSDKAKWKNGIIPILVIIIGTVTALVYTGINSLNEKGIYDYGIREIISSSDSYASLLWSSFAACIVAITMTVSQKIMTLTKSIDAWYKGVRSMLFALIILTLAWAISNITQEVKTADYIIFMLSDNINPRYLPVLVFLVCALTSFSTGTSWGTMAIMMPIVIPLSNSITSIYSYTPTDSTLILHGVISSVLAGSVFGDHCSPIADTTILSSMASSCDHIDHVKTQLPYAVLVAVVSMIVGDIPTAFGFSPFVSIGLITVILILILLILGKKLNREELNI